MPHFTGATYNEGSNGDLAVNGSSSWDFGINTQFFGVTDLNDVDQPRIDIKQAGASDFHPRAAAPGSSIRVQISASNVSYFDFYVFDSDMTELFHRIKNDLVLGTFSVDTTIVVPAKDYLFISVNGFRMDASFAFHSASYTLNVTGTLAPAGLFTENGDTVDFNNLTTAQRDELAAGKPRYDALGGNDVVMLPNANVTVPGGWNSATIFSGGAGKDTITGGNRDDQIDGGAGDDTLSGGAGKDRLDGGGGTDTVLIDANAKTYASGKNGLRIGYEGGKTVVTTIENDTDTDKLFSIERIRFADGKEVALDGPWQTLLKVSHSAGTPSVNGAAFNQGLTVANNAFVTGLLGAPDNASISDLIVKKSVGLFSATGLDPALASLKAVLQAAAAALPDLTPLLSNFGMYNVRNIDGSSSFSNHSWGIAIDLKVDMLLDQTKDGYVLSGLAALIPFFNAAGWIAGAGFSASKEDGMHFEVAKETLATWFDKGWQTDADLVGGTDTFYSATNVTLSAAYRNAVLLDDATAGGGRDRKATGNSDANIIVGNKEKNILSGLEGDDELRGGDGNDVLSGGLGRDVLTGGLGNDSFLFDTAPRSDNRDKITDFSSGAGNNDRLQFAQSVFDKLGGPGAVNADFFALTTATQDNNDYLLYDPTSGILSYDADANGGGAAVQVAYLSTRPSLSASDLFVV